MADIVLTGDTSGAITVAAPAVAGTNTITLPAATGTLATTATAGKILQVVQATHNTEVGTTGTTMIDSGLTASITPSASSSKVLVLYNMPYLNQDSGGIMSFQIVRGTTAVYNQARAVGKITAGTQTAQYLDSPSTTSATTYKLQFCNFGTVSTASYIMWNSQAISSITLLEVAS